MNYRELQKALKAFRDKGMTAIKLNVKKIVLLKEYLRIKASESKEVVATTIEEGLDMVKNFIHKNLGIRSVFKHLDKDGVLAKQFETKEINDRYDPNRCIHTDKLRWLKGLYVGFCYFTNNQIEVTASDLIGEVDDWY